MRTIFVFITLLPCSFLFSQTKDEPFCERVNHYFYQSNYDSVLGYYEQHVPVVPDADSISATLNLVAKCYYYLGQNNQSLLTYQKILLHPPHDPEILACVYCTYAEVLTETTQYESARQQLSLAERILSEIKNTELHTLMFNNRGVLHLRTSDFSMALHDLTIALRGAQEINDKKLISQILTNIGIVHYTMGNYWEALRTFGDALEIDLIIKSQKDLAVDYLNLGNVYNDLNDKLKSIEFFLKAKQVYSEINDSAGISMVLGNLSTVYIDLKKYEQAERSLNEAVIIARMNGDRLGEVEWLYSIALIDYGKGNYAASYKALQYVAGQFEILKNYLKYGQVLIDMGKCKEKLGEYDVSEKLFREAVKNYESRNLPNELWRAQSNLAKLYAALNRSSEADTLFLASIQKIENSRDELTRELTTYFIEDNRLDVYRSYVMFLIKQNRYEAAFEVFEKAKSRNLADILFSSGAEKPVRSSDSDSTVFLEYFLHTDGSFAFVKLHKKLTVIPIGDKGLIDKLLLDYLTQIKQKRKNKDAFLLLSKKLYREIWEPVEKKIQLPPNLTIVPDEWLYYLPFESLFDGKNFIVERFEIKYTPSAAVEQNLHYSWENGRNVDFISVFSQSSFSGMSPLSGFEDLSYVELEKDHILNIFQDSAAVYSDKSSATLSIFDSLLERSSIIHFAAHGINNFERPLMSAIFLFEPDSLSNGLLTAIDIQKLRLNHKLVVLSACETSLGHLLKGEGMLGLTRAFMIAGASSVIASMWNVYDQSTAEFMRLFYEQKVNQKLSSSKALQQAKLEMIRHEEWCDPSYWAPFVIWGSGH